MNWRSCGVYEYKTSTVAVVEVYSAAVTARELGLCSPPPSSVNADAALMLSSVRKIWMLCKVESTVLLVMDDRVVNRKFGMMELEAVMVGTMKTQ